MANIHWTVYTWLLDPYYRILEVYCDGERVAKASLIPLIIQDRRVLSIDAIEVVPKLERDYLQGQANPNLSSRLFRLRRDILNAVFQMTTEDDQRMGMMPSTSTSSRTRTGCVRWSTLCRRSFTMLAKSRNRSRKSPIRRAVRDWLAISNSEVCGEVQALNLHLMDQGLKFGYKEVAVLFGDLPPSFSARSEARSKSARTDCSSPELAWNPRNIVVPPLKGDAAEPRNGGPSR